MHREWGHLPASTAEAIRSCKAGGGRVVAVGTTTVRVLETVAASGPVRQWSGETDLFVRPHYDFRCVDALVTNFHLPRSTLLLLVAAFAGVELTRAAYRAPWRSVTASSATATPCWWYENRYHRRGRGERRGRHREEENRRKTRAGGTASTVTLHFSRLPLCSPRPLR